MRAHGVFTPRDMGVDHGGRGNKYPQKLEWGTLMHIVPSARFCHIGTKRSVLWPSKYTRIRFRPELCPGPSWRSSPDSPRHLSRLGWDTPPLP